MSAPGDDAPIFCDTCQHNQALYTGMLAEYFPDEDEPEYEIYAAKYDEYKDELEERYPQVCKECLPRVQAQIRSANHVARADNLARLMEATKTKQAQVQTWRQAVTLNTILLAKYTYIFSTLVGVLWHTVGLIMAQNEGEGIWVDQTFSLDICLSQAFSVRSVDESCVLSPSIVKLMHYAIAADLFTIWWNPKLKKKTNSLTGRMRGIKPLLAIRATVILLRFASLHYWQHAAINYATIKTYQYTHLFMLVVLALSTVLTWKTVRVVYGAPPSFPKSTHEPVLSTPSSAQKARKGSYHPAHPEPDIFNGMAQAFTSGIYQESSPLPPSPTLTEASYTTHATEATTPFAQRSTFLKAGDADDMDWTPTKARSARFSSQPPEILSNAWRSTQQQQPSPPPQQPHSIFARRDSNPFRHRVPALPVTKPSVWKPGIWAPLLKETTPNFFKDASRNAAGGESKGLDGFGVPKNVKRDAELFASPKLKYDNYGTMKDTGLEDRFEKTFNDMFSK
jgi:hypothetical protein